MGLVKSEWIESEARGWHDPSKFVCADCVDDEFLKSVVLSHLENAHCDYCDSDSEEAIAAPLSEILAPVSKALYRYFSDPSTACLPRDSGEWVGEERITDTEDALLSLPLNVDAELFDDIANSFTNTAWYPCANGHWLDLHEHVELHYSWLNFVDEIKFRSRFFFSGLSIAEEGQGDDSSRPFDLLRSISEMSESLGLITNINIGTKLFRVRNMKPEDNFTSFDEVGPPPPERALAGRMNPAGISYFYLALEDKTALAEVAIKPPMSVSEATFVTARDLLVLDLSALPEIPSVFDDERAEEREHLLFLHDFVSAISEPVTRNGQEHIDYVPSQVVSEYLAQVFRTKSGEILDAVVYPSAMMPNGKNIVIFPVRYSSHSFEERVELLSINKSEFWNWPDLIGRLA